MRLFANVYPGAHLSPASQASQILSFTSTFILSLHFHLFPNPWLNCGSTWALGHSIWCTCFSRLYPSCLPSSCLSGLTGPFPFQLLLIVPLLTPFLTICPHGKHPRLVGRAQVQALVTVPVPVCWHFREKISMRVFWGLEKREFTQMLHRNAMVNGSKQHSEALWPASLLHCNHLYTLLQIWAVPGSGSHF